MASVKVKPVLIPETIGGKIDLRQKLVATKAEIQAQIDAIDGQIRDVESALFAQMDKEGTTNGGGKTATVSINESVVPQIEDWDSFYAFIHRHKYYHLLERRPSVTGCRELFETKGKIPGVMPYTKRKLNFTSRKG